MWCGQSCLNLIQLIEQQQATESKGDTLKSHNVNVPSNCATRIKHPIRENINTVDLHTENQCKFYRVSYKSLIIMMAGFCF